MATIRPADLPAADNVPTGAAIIVDTGSTVQKATPEKIVDAAAPLASEADAINGVGNNNRMSALRVKQAMDANLATTAALASTEPGKGAGMVGFRPAGTGAKTDRKVGDKLLDLGVDIRDFNGVDPTGNNSSSVALSNAIAEAIAAGVYKVNLGSGIYTLDSQQTLSSPIAIIGQDYGYRQSGTVLPQSTLRWGGGATSMFLVTGSHITMRGFAVDNVGAATDFMEATSNGQNSVFTDLYFYNTATHVPFSRSVFRATGNCYGYSKWSGIRASSPAPIFLDIDGNGTGNAITPIFFDGGSARNLFRAGAGDDFTILKLTDETIETVKFSDTTVIMDGAECCLVDTATASVKAAKTIRGLAIRDCEFDTDNTETMNAAWRFFRLENVANAAFVNNDAYGGGGLDYFADLIGSGVTSCEGNNFTGFAEYVFNPDSASHLRAGRNNSDWSTVKGLFPPSVKDAGLIKLAYSPSIWINGEHFSQNKHEVCYVDVTNGSGYNIRLDLTRPGYMTPGQVFTVVVRNVTESAIAAPGFTTAFKTEGATTAPAAGNQRSFTFVFDGTNAIEINRTTADVAIT